MNGDIVLINTLEGLKIARVVDNSQMEDTQVIDSKGDKYWTNDKYYKNITQELNKLGYRNDGDFQQGWNAAIDAIKNSLTDLKLHELEVK